MTQRIDLGAEAVEFVRRRMTEIIGEDPQNITKIKFNMKEVKGQIFRLFYDYQVVRNWSHVATNTADVLDISEMHVHRLAKKHNKNHKLTFC